MATAKRKYLKYFLHSSVATYLLLLGNIGIGTAAYAEEEELLPAIEIHFENLQLAPEKPIIAPLQPIQAKPVATLPQKLPMAAVTPSGTAVVKPSTQSVKPSLPSHSSGPATSNLVVKKPKVTKAPAAPSKAPVAIKKPVLETVKPTKAEVKPATEELPKRQVLASMKDTAPAPKPIKAPSLKKQKKPAKKPAASSMTPVQKPVAPQAKAPQLSSQEEPRIEVITPAPKASLPWQSETVKAPTLKPTDSAVIKEQPSIVEAKQAPLETPLMVKDQKQPILPSVTAEKTSQKVLPELPAIPVPSTAILVPSTPKEPMNKPVSPLPEEEKKEKVILPLPTSSLKETKTPDLVTLTPKPEMLSSIKPSPTNEAPLVKEEKKALSDVKAETLLEAHSPKGVSEPLALLSPSAPKAVIPEKAPSKTETLQEGASLKLEFAKDQTELVSEEQAKLEGLIQHMKDHKEQRIKLVSYASGTPEQPSSARRVSLQRAISVRKYFIEKGIEPTRINVQALGDEVSVGSKDHMEIMQLPNG